MTPPFGYQTPGRGGVAREGIRFTILMRDTGAYRAISCCRTRASGVVLEVGKWEGCGRGVFRRAVRGGGGSSRRGAGEGRLQEAGRGASHIAFLRTSA